jgi:propanol-preferring alcohol dehydrogenase
MKAMLLKKIVNLDQDRTPLEMADVPVPVIVGQEILIRVTACGVCHTELDEIEGRTPPRNLPVIPGHQVVGRVEQSAKKGKFQEGQRVGVAWIFSACGKCDYCRGGNENLCEQFTATGRDADGGYAEYMKVPEDFATLIPDVFTDSQAAPLLCAGAIGYRSLKLTNLQDGQRLGLTGFGASAHLVLKLAKRKYPRSKIYVFARSESERAFAKELGADWTGDTIEQAPELLHCIIDTTPVWNPVLRALENLAPNGRLVINAIRKEHFDQDSLLQLDYARHLWMEKEIKSVANVSRKDVSEFLSIAAEVPILPEIQEYELEDANRALVELKQGKIQGAKVLKLA